MKHIPWLLAALLLSGTAQAQPAGSAPIISAAAEKSHVMKAAPGFLIDVYVTPSTTAGFLLIYNATSAPIDGTVAPQSCIAVPASTTSGYVTGDTPEWFTVGITAVFSTNAAGCFAQTGSNAFFYGRVK